MTKKFCDKCKQEMKPGNINIVMISKCNLLEVCDECKQKIINYIKEEN